MIEIEDKNDIPKILVNLKGMRGSVDVGIFGSSGSELVEIATAHEFETTITPKNKKWLTVPLRKELKGKRATDFKLEFLIPKDSGGKYALLVKRQGKSVVPYYLLMRKIVIPERAFLRSTFDSDKFAVRIGRVIERLIDRALSTQSFNPESVLAGIGEEAVALIKERINNGEFAKNSPITTNMKGGKPPLYDTGRLRDAITYKVGK
jgi:hypothetical protein